MNAELKTYIKCRGLCYYEMAQAMGIDGSTFTRRMQKPLTAGEIRDIKRIARELYVRKYKQEGMIGNATNING